ncbi:MAG: reprolysin-like metallopeptidase [Flavobacteriales bacterium]
MLKNHFSRSIFKFSLFCLLGISSIQELSAQFTYQVNPRVQTTGTEYILPSSYSTFAVQHQDLKSILYTAPHETTVSAINSSVQLNLPMPDGSLKAFKLVESPIYEAGFSLIFPDLRTYAVIDPTHRGIKGRIDISPYGFHAMIKTPEGYVYIDPYTHQNTSFVKSYYRKDYQPVNQNAEVFSCETTDPESIPAPSLELPSNPPPVAQSGEELRVFRLALACTGEYAAFHGGTVAQAQAAMLTTINRVNEVYENDFAVRLVLVANNNVLIELNAATDPYTNGTTGTMINEAQTEITNAIGPSNFDIGHLFGTDSGGLAGLGVVCSNAQKARGVTGSGAPVNDPFDIDYVAHEMGHQFGCHHTQNNTCQRTASAAYEPGSASTIMGYAGICAPNIQGNSDPNFHIHSINQAKTLIDNSATCYTTLDFNNTPPVVDVTGMDGFTIPISTPFELTASSTDAEGDVVTYSWEQFDLGPSTSSLADLNNPTGTAPIFRSWPPTENPTRVFPRLQDLVNNTTVIGELLPTYARGLSFRVSARDNHLSSGGVDYQEIDIVVSDAGGPFALTSPNGGVSIPEYASFNVIWEVGQTNLPPYNSPQVDIFLSTDGGLTYPITLAENEANDGSATVEMPFDILADGQTSLTTARIKVKSANSIFFDISDANFTITEPEQDDFVLQANTGLIQLCSPTLDTSSVNLVQILDFSSDITLSATNVPGDAIVSFHSNPNTVGTSVDFDINPGTLTNGAYSFTINGDGGGLTHSVDIEFFVSDGMPVVATLISPADEAIDVALGVTHQWEAQDNVASYQIQVATDSLFTDIIRNDTIYTNSWTANPAYESNVELFWHLLAINGCGVAEWSDTLSFTSTNSDPILGCTNPDAVNYNPAANIDDGSCIDVVEGCTNPDATNYNPDANQDDGSCSIEGCTNPNALNYNPEATEDDGSCVILGCMDPTAFNYNPEATVEDGSCIELVEGCMDPGSLNYNAEANTDDGSCVFTIEGCTDPTALNYNPAANLHDFSCDYGIPGCTDPSFENYNPNANVDNGTCDSLLVYMTYTIVNDSIYEFLITPSDDITLFEVNWLFDDGTSGQIGNPTQHYFAEDGSYTITSISTTDYTSTYIYQDTTIEVNLRGCTDPYAANFDYEVVIDDGSCEPHVFDCTNPDAENYNPDATYDDGSCVVLGCTDPTAVNYNTEATVDDGSCVATVLGCTDPEAFNYNADANVDDGSCEAVLEGCTDPLAFNYNSAANTDDGSCIEFIYGCTDSEALNFDSEANTDDGSCNYDPNTSSVWDVTPTSENHTILIPETAAIDLNGSGLESGDIIGVFYTTPSGSLQCGGKVTWTGASTTLSAFGNEFGSSVGFDDNDVFAWKVWDSSAVETYAVSVEYDALMPNTSFYQNDGISSIIGMLVGSSQAIDMSLGWNLISTYIQPTDPEISAVMAPISADIELVKDETGQVYWPEFDINNIGDLTIGKAYKVKADADLVWNVQGTAVIPQNHNLTLNQGWSYLGYLRQVPANISAVLASISDDIFIVKNINGDVYWPGFNVNNIGNMEPGVGYQINMTSASNFVFPSNAINLPQLKLMQNQQQTTHYTAIEQTTEHMHLAIPEQAWLFDVELESELAVYDEDGTLRGACVYTGYPTVLTIFGNETETELTQLTFKLWTGSEEKEVILDKNTAFAYQKDAAQVVQILALKTSSDWSIDVFAQDNQIIVKALEASENQSVNIKVYSALGQLVHSENLSIESETTALNLSAQQFAQGVYHVRVESGTKIKNTKVLVN